ncbi:MAG: hypothetical protein ABIL01_06205 [Pseudomonadota bacterium]
MFVSFDFLIRHCERSEAIHRRQAKKLEDGNAAATIKTVVARLDRAIQYAAASRFILGASGYWVARSSRATTAKWMLAAHFDFRP